MYEKRIIHTFVCGIDYAIKEQTNMDDLAELEKIIEKRKLELKHD